MPGCSRRGSTSESEKAGKAERYSEKEKVFVKVLVEILKEGSARTKKKHSRQGFSRFVRGKRFR